MRVGRHLCLVCGITLGGCYNGLQAVPDGSGASGSATAGDSDGGPSEVEPPAEIEEVARLGLRRLTAAEYDATLRDLLFDDQSTSTLLLPTDARTPFDNDYTTQIPSEALVEAAELLASDAADRLADDPARLAMVLPCTPSGADDEGCLRQLVTRLGRRALRRPLSDAEIDQFVEGSDGEGALALAIEHDDFNVAVHHVVRTLLQDPEFLYRVEIGTPVDGEPGLFKLSGFEMSSRLSYFLWGSAPDDWVLDLAEEGALDTPDDVREAAAMMLTDERALGRVDRFHAMWMGYETMPFGGELGTAMRTETRALVERVMFEQELPWQELFRSSETFVNDTLAEHYGLPAPGSEQGAWVDYADTGRQGLLSHGTFLSNGGKFGDTSPVQRGLMVRTQLFCQDIPPPPPGVDVDEEPQEGVCKPERYAAHSSGGCAACHQQIDPIGFGLENYGPLGEYRAFEPDNPDTPDDESTCEISGAGSLSGVGEFNGPAELARLGLQERYIDRCLQMQLYRFMVGRYELQDNDFDTIERVDGTLGGDEFTFESLLLEMVGSESFGFRREEDA